MVMVSSYAIVKVNKADSMGKVKEFDDILIQMALIFFQSEHIIGHFVNNKVSDIFLTAHSINSDDAARYF